MKKIQSILAAIIVSFVFTSCTVINSDSLETSANLSGMYVYINSNLKEMYVSTDKDTVSINVCKLTEDSKQCEKDSLQNITEVFKETDTKKIFKISNQDSIKNLEINRLDEDKKVLSKRDMNLIQGIFKNSDDKYAPNPEEVELSKDELDMIVEVNKYREKNGRSILIVSKRLMDGARAQSQKMKIQGQEHWLYPSNGANAENIFVYATTVQQAMYGGGYASHGFTQSPGHNANILNGSFKYVGIGNVPNQTYGCWTQRFSYYR